MSFQHGTVYRAPNGNCYRANLEGSDADAAWILVPVDFEQVHQPGWRVRLSQLLFLKKDKIVTLHFGAVGPSIHDTGWKDNDFVPAK
jgi:hypothetical protein